MRALIGLVRATTGVLVLWIIAWIVTGDAWAAVRIGVYMSPFLLGIAFALSLLAVWLRRWVVAGLAALVAMTLAASSPASLFRVWSPASAAAVSEGISLVSLSNRTANADMVATSRSLIVNRADIFVLQEIANPRALVEHLVGLYEVGRSPKACWLGTYLIVSRFELSPAHRLAGNEAIRCKISLPAGPAVVYSVHLPRAVRDASRQRAAIARLLADAKRQTAPVILAGDFNATPMSQTMRAIVSNLVNAFDHVGDGPGFTFPTPARRLGTIGPFLRIDHVVLSQVLAPVRAKSARWYPPGADHFPVEVVFQDSRHTDALTGETR